MGKNKLIQIGTSGWHYRHWEGAFYPANIRQKDFLNYYIQHFHTVEINNSFYQLPKEKTLKLWYDTAPDNFIFAVKASRYITHMKKLKDPEKTLSKFLNRIDVLKEKLGPILFQLPPRWKVNPERLEAFLRALHGDYDSAFEFRDPTWFTDEVFHILAEHNAALCIYHFNHRMSPKEVTANFVYIRLHGPNGPYEGRYGRRTLSYWAEDIIKWKKQKKRIFCYFDNDEAGYAPQDAAGLKQIVEK